MRQMVDFDCQEAFSGLNFLSKLFYSGSDTTAGSYPLKVQFQFCDSRFHNFFLGVGFQLYILSVDT